MAGVSLTLLLTLLDDAFFLPEWCACVRRLAPDEVLVVDGGSTDGGPESLEAQDLPNLRLLRRPMQEIDWHYSRQLNFAATHARGDWVLLLDADEILWPPRRRLLTAALADAGRVVSFWLARFHLWPDERTRLDCDPRFDPQPRLWRREAGIVWVRKAHNQQTLRGRIVGWEHPQAQLLAEPVLLHRKELAPRPLRLARHRRWRTHWGLASAAAGLPIPEALPEEFGPTRPLPADVANWRARLMRGSARERRHAAP